MHATEDKIYKIVRRYEKGNFRTIKRGLTLSEAQEHCRRSDTKNGSPGEPGYWCDGYDFDIPKKRRS